MDERLGTVTIAPEVLITIARLVTLSQPGVAHLSHSFTGQVGRLFRRTRRADGVRIAVEDDLVTVDLHIVVAPQVHMLKLGQQIQAEVARAIQDIVGMGVRAVNVHIEDVAVPPLAESSAP